MRYTSIKLAKWPCLGKVTEQRKRLKCNDLWRVLEMDETGRVKSIKCLSHGHVSRGKEKLLVNKL